MIFVGNRKTHQPSPLIIISIKIRTNRRFNMAEDKRRWGGSGRKKIERRREERKEIRKCGEEECEEEKDEDEGKVNNKKRKGKKSK